MRSVAATLSLSTAGLLCLAACGSSSVTPPSPLAGTPAGNDAPAGQSRLPGHVLSGLGQGRAAASSGTAGRTQSTTALTTSETLTLTIVLNRTDRSGFEAYLHAVQDPASPLFRKYLTPAEVSDRFGPTQGAYDTVRTWVETQGFTVVEGSPNRLTLTVRGTRPTVEKTFSIHIWDYRLGDRTFFANDGDPAVPAALASVVHSIVGLSNFAQPRPIANVIPHNAAGDALWDALCLEEQFFGGGSGLLFAFTLACPVCAAVATAELFSAGLILAITENNTPLSLVPKYLACVNMHSQTAALSAFSSLDPPPPAWQGVDGTGQTVGLLEFDTFQPSDVSDYVTLMGLPPAAVNNVTQVHFNGGATPGPDQDEVLLDIANVLTGAPGAKIAVYDAPFSGAGTSFQGILNAMINGGVTIISNSWAYCEDQTTLADVQGIDAILQTAAASGITVLSGTGDGGSTCLDGSPNTVAVPAGAPHITAVGGTSLTVGPGFTYVSEKWWDGTHDTPPTGQGGFGVSRYFPRPDYQVGLVASTARSVPDVATNADPARGVVICQAGAGGCPTGLFYGGTSSAAPAWAAYVALLNQAQGTNLGFLNPLLYPLAGTDAFHGGNSMGSDFGHVGLGSPNLSRLHQRLTGQATGPASPNVSTVTPYLPRNFSFPRALTTIPNFADGKTPTYVVVNLLDANGNTVDGKTVTLAASAGSHAVITPPSGVTTADLGSVVFTVTDDTLETVMFTATDTTDGIALASTPQIIFVTPPAASAGINAFPPTVTADGASMATITLTLADALGRPTAGKLVNLTQSGHSVISGPTPPLTDANGQIVYTAVDQVAETVTYSATDVVDRNLAFPSTATVTFSGGPGNGCGNATPIAAPGFVVTPYATGFRAQNFSFGGVNFSNCPGAFGLAFDSAGNLFVAEAPTGDIYKFPPGGGVAGASTLLTATPIGPSVGQLAFDKSGNLYAGRYATTGNFLTGAVLKIDPNTGSVLSTVAAPLTCPGEIAIDPLSGDLFVGDSCGGGGSDNPSLWRVSNPGGASPVTSLYATMPGGTNATIAFSSGGQLYLWDFLGNPQIVEVSGTSGPATPIITPIPFGTTPSPSFIGMLAGGAQTGGNASYLFLNYAAVGATPGGIGMLDLTTTPATLGTMLVGSGVTNNNNFAYGSDGCVYVAAGVAVFRISDARGGCSYAAPVPGPSVVLTPTVVSPSPAQGSSQTFTAALHNVLAPAGAPVYFQVTGANPQISIVHADAGGHASFSYVATHAGTDSVIASAAVGTATVTSNPVLLTWTPGIHATLVTLNLGPSAAPTSTPVTVQAQLFDTAVTPNAPVAGQPLTLGIAGQTCIGTTDATGTATCTITSPAALGPTTFTATFSGTAQFQPSSASRAFLVTSAVVATSLTYTGPRTFANGASTSFSAVLTQNPGAVPLAGQSILFTLGSGNAAQSCSGTTDASGTASCTVATVNQPVGTGSLVIMYAGDATSQAASAPVSVTVQAAAQPTTLAYTGPMAFTNGSAGTLSATLTATQGGAPSIGKSIAFTLGVGPGAQGCSATTGTNGAASCTIAVVNQPVGPGSAAASFAGDATDLASSVQTPVTIQASTTGSPPTISCPAAITVRSAPGQCAASVAFQTPTSGQPAPTTMCAIGSTLVRSPFAFPVGTSNVMCTARNGVPPDASCSFAVRVRDVEAPSIKGLRAVTPVRREERHHDHRDEGGHDGDGGLHRYRQEDSHDRDRSAIRVTIEYTAADNCGAPRCTLEVAAPARFRKSDAVVLDAHHVLLREDGGEPIAVTVNCRDGAGNEARKTVTVKRNERVAER